MEQSKNFFFTLRAPKNFSCLYKHIEKKNIEAAKK